MYLNEGVREGLLSMQCMLIATENVFRFFLNFALKCAFRVKDHNARGQHVTPTVYSKDPVSRAKRPRISCISASLDLDSRDA